MVHFNPGVACGAPRRFRDATLGMGEADGPSLEALSKSWRIVTVAATNVICRSLVTGLVSAGYRYTRYAHNFSVSVCARQYPVYIELHCCHALAISLYKNTTTAEMSSMAMPPVGLASHTSLHA